MKGQILVTFIVVLFFLGCKKEASTDVDALPVGLIGPYSNLHENIQSIDLTCSDPKSCPQSVGLVMGYNRTEQTLKYCTGFLIESNAIVTSAECVDPELMESSLQACSRRLVIRFVDNLGNSQTATCARIRERSVGGVYDPNYAVVELSERLSMPTLDIHRDGLVDEQDIFVPKINMRGNNTSASLDVQSCKVGLKTLLHTRSVNPWAQTAIGINCEAREGNWGAPILNKDHRVIGILQNNWQESFSREVSKNYRLFDVKDSQRIISNILFTNSSCISSLGSFYEQEKCESMGRADFSDCYGGETEKSESSRNEILEQWALQLPQIFVFKIIANETQTKFKAEPICVKTKTQYLKYDQFVIQEGVWGFRREKIVFNYPQKIELKPRYTIYDDLRIDVEFAYELSGQTSNTIDITKKKYLWQGNLQTLVNSGENEGGRIVVPLSIKDCTLEQASDGNKFVIEQFNYPDSINRPGGLSYQKETDKLPHCD